MNKKIYLMIGLLVCLLSAGCKNQQIEGKILKVCDCSPIIEDYSDDIKDLQEQTKMLRQNIAEVSTGMRQLQDNQIAETKRVNERFYYTEVIKVLSEEDVVIPEEETWVLPPINW